MNNDSISTVLAASYFVGAFRSNVRLVYDTMSSQELKI